MQQRQMLLTEIPLNPSVEEKDELRLSRQAWVIYDRLTDKYLNRFFGPPSNRDLAELSHSLNWTARATEIRQALKLFGLTLKIVKKGKDGLNYYGIVNLEE